MPFFNNLKVQAKLLLVISVTTLYFIILFLLSFYIIQGQNEALNRINNERVAILKQANEISTRFAELNMNLYRIISWNSAGTYDSAYIADFAQKQSAEFSLIQDSIVSFNENPALAQSEKELITTILENYGQYENFIGMVTDSVITSGLGSMGTFFMISADDEYRKINLSIQELRSLEESLLVELFLTTDATRKKMMLVYMTASFFMLLSLLLFVLFISKVITNPIKKTLQFIKVLQTGDLTSVNPVSSRDEIGSISASIDELRLSMSGLVRAIKKQSSALNTIGFELSSNMNETAAAINQISANIQSIRKQTETQSDVVHQTKTNLEDITVNIEMLNKLIEEQSTNVSQSSSAIEEMLANIASVSVSLVKNAEIMIELSSASEKGRIDLNSVSENIRNVARESESLLGISSVIQGIASQTNLLAMNAAIEAAHAGEAGQGFSVVATEIRKLAESSGTQAKTVSSVLKKIMNAMGQITKSTDIVLSQFEDIDNKIKSVSEHESGIRHSMEEQGNGSKQILVAIEHLSDITRKVQDGSVKMLLNTKNVIVDGEKLGRITDEVTNSMNEMASGVQQINSAVNTVNDISRENKDSIETLVREVEQFKIVSGDL